MPCVSQLIIDFSMSFGSLFQAILFFVHLKSFFSFYLFCLCLHARVPQQYVEVRGQVFPHGATAPAPSSLFHFFQSREF